MGQLVLAFMVLTKVIHAAKIFLDPKYILILSLLAVTFVIN